MQIAFQHGAPELVDAFEQATFDLHQLAAQVAIAGIGASCRTRDHLSGLGPELVEPCRRDDRAFDVGLRREQRFEVAPELRPQRGRSLFFHDELGEDAIHECGRVRGLRARELRQEHTLDGVAQLPVVQRPVVAGLSHAILDLTRVTLTYGRRHS